MNNQIQLVLKSSTTELSLNDRELGIYLTPELDGLTGLPEIRTTSGVNAGYDGGWTSAQNYDARSITIRGVIANEDVATVEQLRRQLTTLAGQGKNEELTLDLVTQAGKAYTIQVRTIALEMSLQKVLTQQEFMLQLRADDPLIYDASETTHEALLQVAQATGGFTIDFELPLAITGSSEETIVNNEGLEQVPTVTRMYGELHNPKIINQTTNQFMQIEADLGFAEGDWTTPSEPVEGKDLTINGAPNNAPISDFKLKGETSQQTYSGKNLVYTKGDTEQDGTPTPDAPQTVKTVTGVNVIKITNKNWIPYPYAGGGNGNGITFTADSDGGVILNGQNNGSGNSAFYLFNDSSFPLQLAAGTYYFINPSNTAVQFVAYDGTSYYNFNNSNNYSQTFDSDKSIRMFYVQVQRYNTTTFSNLKIMPMLSTQAGQTDADFELGQDQKYEVNLHGNLYDKSSAVKSAANVSLTMDIDPSTSYVFDTGRTWTTAHLYDSSGTRTRTLGNTSSTRKVDFTTTSSEVKVQLAFYIGQSTPIETYDFTGVDFYKPEDAIELCKIDTYQDYIYKSGDKWYKHAEIGKTDLANYSYVVASSILRRTTAIPNMKYVSSNTQVGSAVAEKYIIHQGQGMSAASLAGYMAIDVSMFAVNVGTSDTSVNPTGLLYYALATPTDTEITNEALIAQLEALAAATMYNPQTNITTLYADGNEQPTLDVSYFTDKNPDTRDELVIDSRLRTITLNGLDVYHLQAPGSEFLMLAPGENRLSLQSDITGDNGYAQVSYKQGYLSI